MLRKFFAVSALLLSNAVFAQTVSDGEFSSALSACEQGHEKAIRRSDIPADYKGPIGPTLVRKFEAGWEHCAVLRKEKEARDEVDRRDRAARVTDERGLIVPPSRREIQLPSDAAAKATEVRRETERKASEDVARRLGVMK